MGLQRVGHDWSDLARTKARVIWTASCIWETSRIMECQCRLGLPKIEARAQVAILTRGCRRQAYYLDSTCLMPQGKNSIWKRATCRAGIPGDIFWLEEQQNACFGGEQWQSFWCTVTGIGCGHYSAVWGGLSGTILWWVIHLDVQLLSPIGPLSLCDTQQPIINSLFA